MIPIDPALTTASCASTENASSFLDDGWEYEYDENEMEVSVKSFKAGLR